MEILNINIHNCSLYWQYNDNKKKPKRQTIIYKVLHGRQTIEQHEPNETFGELGCSGGLAIPIPLVTTIALLLNTIKYK
jgi:hypothetical protein